MKRNIFAILGSIFSAGMALAQPEVTITIGYPDHADYFIYSIPPADEHARFGGEYYLKVENTGSVPLVNWQLHTYWKALNNTWGVVQKTVINSQTGEIQLQGPNWDTELAVGESFVLNGEWVASSSVEDWIEFLPRNTSFSAQGNPDVAIVYDTQGTLAATSYSVQKVKPFDASRKTFAEKKIIAYFPVFDAERAWCSLRKYGDNIDELRVQLYSITPSGQLRAGQDLPAGVDPVQERDYWLNQIDQMGVVDYCQQHGIQLVPVVYNYNSNLGDFDQNAVHAMMTTPALRSQHIADLLDVLSDHPEFAGIDIDYESLQAADRDNYSAFMEDLAVSVHGVNKILTTAVHTKAGPGTWYGPQAQDYERIGNAVDEILLMTYDLHWATSPTYNNPPPTAGCQATPDWMNDVASFAVSEINDPSKIQLGLPFYGYRWKLGFENHTLQDPGVGLTHEDAQDLIATYGIAPNQIAREANGKENNFVVNINGVNWTCYYQDSTSLAYKLSALLENELNDYIGGVGVWRLGGEDNGMWRAVVEQVKGTSALITEVNCEAGIDQITPEAILLYPNPALDKCMINFPGENGTAQFYTITGELLFSTPLSKGENVLNIVELSAGMYLVHVNGTMYRLHKG